MLFCRYTGAPYYAAISALRAVSMKFTGILYLHTLNMTVSDILDSFS